MATVEENRLAGLRRAIATWGVICGDNATNNVVEYSELIEALRWATFEGLRGVEIYSDSQLMVNQVNDVWKCNKELLIKDRDAARRMMAEVEATLS
jgi:ribonuclease HI